jgi:Pyruvate:ferredoxin oxidoreductase and related 2-oxoacid:ferredoxin oxidoreductases, beta subunit
LSENGGNGNGNGALTAKDFRTDQEVRWCPGCGDYAILAALQSFMPELGIGARTPSSSAGSAARRASRTT